MSIKRNLCFAVLLLFFLNNLFAQEQKKKNNQESKKSKDFYNLKAPSIEYSKPDTSEYLFEEEFSDESEAEEPVYFDPKPGQSIVSEDTSSEDEGELSVVEEAEQLNIDSSWITIAEYYSIWDSKSVNPYKIDATTFNDTLPIVLYDTAAGFSWSMPISSNVITSDFGMRQYRWHYGTDIKLAIGDPVLAAFDGIVRIQQYDRQGYGTYILLRHKNGLETIYGHLSRADVKVGQYVKAGEKIGLGGNTGRSTGPHLHFEVRYEGNAINAEYIYDFPNNTLRGNIFELMPEHYSYLKTARKVSFHKIRSGENLGTISRKYHVSISTLCRLNRITTRTTLRVGRKLRIR